MERRDVIKYTAFFMGASLSSSTIASLLAGCKVDTSPGWMPTHFNQAEADFISEVGETILPKTSTPGAKDAMVERFIDTIRPLRFSAEENERFKKDLNQLMQQAKTDLGKDFVSASPEKKLEWVTAIDKSSFDALKAQPDMPDEEKPFFLNLKAQILGGYFSSEIVANDYFAFDPVPGRYDPCIAYEEVGRAWAI